MLVKLQRLGKCLIYPIAILPFAAILNRVGQLGIQYTVSIPWLQHIFQVIQFPGVTVFNNLGLIFAIALAFGYAKDLRGEAALMGGLAYIIMTTFLGENGMASWFYSHVLDWKQSDFPSGFPFKSGHSRLLYGVTYTDPQDASKGSFQYILDIGVFGGIFLGCFSAFFYNRFKEIKLHPALSFFSGRRFLPMVVLSASIPFAVLFAAIWPWFQYALLSMGEWIGNGSSGASGSKLSYNAGASLKAGGFAFVYGIINRLMQPFGLHHILNTFLWFQLPINGNLLVEWMDKSGTLHHAGSSVTIYGDINAFMIGVNGAGVFQTGYFPMFLGGLPATALAMVMTAKKDNRKQVLGFLSGVAAVAFLTGIDEPLAFSFIFVSPLLWGIHAFLTGFFSFITVALNIRVGFGFSAGFIDYIISLPMSWEHAMSFTGGGAKVFSNPLIIFPLAAACFGCYYITFYYIIKRFDVATPGRHDVVLKMSHLEEKEVEAEHVERALGDSDHIDATKVLPKVETDKYYVYARNIVDGVGGPGNIVKVENCATRLRIELKDNSPSIVNDTLIKQRGGAYAIKRLGKKAYQIIIGTDVEHVANRINDILKKE
ncbi:PTS transporter subunit EIIC [Mycoplasma sp. SG1]|uniref:PTS transporter subunit EIIC n=1 Tax=Mycoplasma sp. SG1 TaxID=2810348 RepID=UPI0020255F48|nr:PTS transporter subunit EIIC [Mycoplasma sp. SG1]URM53014.1 PTS transporter subunit EIIC [Mycoplasma sp. SG1]